MKRFLCMSLILLLLPFSAMADSTPPTDWPLVPASQGSDAFNKPQWAQMRQDCETYQGPGETYAQDHYHDIKVDQWIQIFGQESEWALILYSPAANVFRFGYCPMSALPESAEVEPIPVWAEMTGNTGSAWITSDPLITVDETLLPQLTLVTYLCALGDQWLYVELIQLDGLPRRGFIRPQSRYELDMFGSAWTASTPEMAATETPMSEPSTTPLPEASLSEAAAVTLAKDVLLTRFHFTQEQMESFRMNSTYWVGDHFPIVWLIEFYKGDYVSGEHVISVGIDANTGDLRGCYIKQNGCLVWLETDELTEPVIAEAYPTNFPAEFSNDGVFCPTPAPTPES